MLSRLRGTGSSEQRRIAVLRDCHLPALNLHSGLLSQKSLLATTGLCYMDRHDLVISGLSQPQPWSEGLGKDLGSLTHYHATYPFPAQVW